DALGVLEVLEVVNGPHPVRTPAGHHDRLFALVGTVERGGHGGVRAVQQHEVGEVVSAHRLVAGLHQTGARVDTDDLAVELISMIVEFGDAVDINVGRHGPADVNTLEANP